MWLPATQQLHSPAAIGPEIPVLIMNELTIPLKGNINVIKIMVVVAGISFFLSFLNLTSADKSPTSY